MSLEQLMDSFEKKEQRDKPISKIKETFRTIEDYLNEHPIVGGILSVGALEALSYITSSRYTYYIDLNFRFGQLVGEFLVTTPNFYLNRELNKKKKFEDGVPSLKKIVSKLCWEHPIIPSIAATGLFLLNTYNWNIQETIQHAKTPWISILATFYCGTAMVIKGIRTYENNIVGDFFGEIGKDIFSRAEINDKMSKNPIYKVFAKKEEKIEKQYRSAEDFLRRGLDMRFTTDIAIDLFYCHLKLDHIDEASVLIIDIIEYLGKENDLNFAEKLGRKGFYKIQDFWDRYEGNHDKEVKNLLELIHFLTATNKKGVSDFFSDLDEELEDDPFGLMLAGKFLSGIGETEKSKEYLMKLLEVLPNTYLTEQDVSRLGYSRRVVEVIDIPEFQSSFVFKEANPNQTKMMEVVSNEFENHATKIITYLDEEEILVEEKASGKINDNLHELLPYLSEREIINAIKEVSIFLADFQSTDFEEKGILIENVVEDNIDYYGDRINELFIEKLSEFSSELDSETKAQLRDDAYSIGKIASTLPTAPYWDANLKNILYLLDGTIKVTDFENTLLKIRGIDWISLTEFGREYLDEDVKARLIWEGFRRNNPNIASEEITKEVLFGGMIRHPELFGYRARDASYFEGELRLECIDSMLFHLSKSGEYSKAIANSQIIDTGDKDQFYRFSKNIRKLDTLIRKEYQEDICDYSLISISKEQKIDEMYNPLRKDYLLNVDMWKTVAFYASLFGGIGWGAFKLIGEIKEFTDKILTNLQP